jgi:hypothetical protein
VPKEGGGGLKKVVVATQKGGLHLGRRVTADACQLVTTGRGLVSIGLRREFFQFFYFLFFKIFLGLLRNLGEWVYNTPIF